MKKSNYIFYCFLLFLTQKSTFANDLCGKFYKEIFINCAQNYHHNPKSNGPNYCGKNCDGSEYILTKKQIGKGCKNFIDKNKNYSHTKYCNPSNKKECIVISLNTECHQMSGGPLVIEGLSESPPMGWIINEKK